MCTDEYGLSAYGAVLVDLQQGQLGLHSFGNEGLEELKTKLADLDQIFFAFYHEEIDVDPGYIIINYIPPSVSAVRRGAVAVMKQHRTQ